MRLVAERVAFRFGGVGEGSQTTAEGGRTARHTTTELEDTTCLYISLSLALSVFPLSLFSLGLSAFPRCSLLWSLFLFHVKVQRVSSSSSFYLETAFELRASVSRDHDHVHARGYARGCVRVRVRACVHTCARVRTGV